MIFCFPIRGPAKNLLHSFLKRKQFVFVNECKSSTVNNNYRIAQGSTLGSPLFLIYYSDLSSPGRCVPRLFADVTCLVYCNKSQQSLNEIINADLLKIFEWFITNKSTVNPSKSNIVIIPPKLNKPPVTIDIYLNSALNPQTTTANYSGIILDSNLKFHHHMLLLEHKILRTENIKISRI